MAHMTFREALAKAYDPNEARADNGEWTSGAGGASSSNDKPKEVQGAGKQGPAIWAPAQAMEKIHANEAKAGDMLEIRNSENHAQSGMQVLVKAVLGNDTIQVQYLDKQTAQPIGGLVNVKMGDAAIWRIPRVTMPNVQPSGGRQATATSPSGRHGRSVGM